MALVLAAGTQGARDRPRAFLTLIVRSLAAASLMFAPASSRSALAQSVTGAVLVRVTSSAAPIAGGRVTAGAATALSDERGEAQLELPAGRQTITVDHQGFARATAVVDVVAGNQVSAAVRLRPLRFESEVTVLAATRTGTVLEDQPLHVEAVPQEELEENLTIAPGRLTTLFEELPGLRIESAAPTLGGVGLRLRGLRGRYTRVLVDELPLLGEEAGSLGLLQTSPLDLAQVEVIKGVSSALYSGALGGVVNLVSRRPEGEPTALVAVSSLRGADAVAFLPHRLSERWGYTLLAASDAQDEQDVDRDGWAELPGYRRATLRPRLYWADENGDSLLATVGAMGERRDGGTLRGRATPAGGAFTDRLGSQRLDGGVVGHFALAGERLLAVHASFASTERSRRRGGTAEHDRLRSGFAEVSLAGSRGRHTWVLGAATHHEGAGVQGGAALVTPGAGAFAQDEYTLSPRLRLAAGGRLDHSARYGTSCDPLVSLLWKPGKPWQVRLAGGAGHALPSLLSDEAAEVGLAAVSPPGRLRTERARSAALDVGWTAGAWEIDGAAFVSDIRDPLVTREVGDELVLANDPGTERARGTELLLRYTRGPLHVIANHTWLDAWTRDPNQPAPLSSAAVPDHAAELAAILESEARGRIGVELAYTGRQRLELDPYRRVSPPYVEINVLGELRFGEAGVFVSATNLTAVRQTRFDPLLLPAQTPAGRWTTDVWGPLAGRAVELGVRFEM